LQENDGREAVHGGGALFDADAALPEDAAGLDRGEALVPELDGNAEAHADGFGELADPDRLAALRPAHVDGIAQQDQADPLLPDDFAEGLEVGALVGADEVGQALGGDAEGVAKGQTDAFFA